MIGGSVPKLLQELRRIKEVMAQIGEGLPSGFSITDLETKINDLETTISQLDAVNAERTELVNTKGNQAEAASDFVVALRWAVRGVFGPNSSEYEQVGGTRASERKRYTRKSGTKE